MVTSSPAYTLASRTSDFGHEMILRLLAVLFGAAALVLGLAFGWSWPLGNLLMRINPNAILSLQDSVQRTISNAAWDSLVLPVLLVPAWVTPATICLILFLVAAFRPGQG